MGIKVKFIPITIADMRNLGKTQHKQRYIINIRRNIDGSTAVCCD
jgi:hypothetical protein